MNIQMKKLSILLPLALLLLCKPLQAQNDRSFEIAKNLEIFADVYKHLNLNYVDDVDPGKAIKTAIDAMLASMDPYTNYYPESDMEDVKLQLLGQYGGIGAIIQQTPDKLILIAEPYKGLPADKAGLKAGDRILSVNEVSTEGKTTADVSSVLRGQAGTEVRLKLERDGKTIEKVLTRSEIQLPMVPYYGMLNEGIGYCKLNEFTKEAATKVREAFKRLKAENPTMKGFVLDLRGNGGGLMNEAVDIVNIFVPRGELVVETKGKVVQKNLKSVTRLQPEDIEIPVAVLIDNYSASASEIVSGSLQDFDRAVVIGERSYGKGLVQNILPLPYNSQMKITVSKYFIPSGRCIQALDYSHRDENGRATKVPDSLKTAYKTRNGRTVYDGFGIEPDVEVQPEFMSNIAMALMQKQLVFTYATDFVKRHATIPAAKDFEITDEIYNDFVHYLNDKDYEYATVSERVLKELRKVAEDEKYLAAIESQLTTLEEQIKKEKADDLIKNRREIAEMLKAELLTRYYYQEGAIEGALHNDPVVMKAISVLSDKEQYRKILGK